MYNGARGIVEKIEWPNDTPPTIPEINSTSSISNNVTTGRCTTRSQTAKKILEVETETMPEAVLIKFFNEKVGKNSDGIQLKDGLRAIRIKPKSLTFNINEVDGVKCKRTQLPLVEAFAVTIHKSQSLTLDRAVIDCGSSIFAPGMAYTALSRVRKLTDLILLKFDASKLEKINESVAQEYQRLHSLPSPGIQNNWATDLISTQLNQDEEMIDEDSVGGENLEMIEENQNEIFLIE